MAGKRKVWQKPELVVLVRNKPEEAVLMGCKQFGGGPRLPGPHTDKCNQYYYYVGGEKVNPGGPCHEKCDT